MRLTARLLHPRGRLRRHSSSCYGWREPAAASGIAGRGVEGIEEIWGGTQAPRPSLDTAAGPQCRAPDAAGLGLPGHTRPLPC